MGMNLKETGIRSLFAFFGVAILAFGVAVLRAGEVGIDPFTSANLATAQLLGLTLGVYQLGLNVIILMFVFFFAKKYIGMGTVINMVLTGFFIDFYSSILQKLGVVAQGMMQQLVFLVVGLLIFTFGASFYMAAAVGQAPYDALTPIMVERLGLKYRNARIIQDTSFLVLSLILGGPIGVGTFAIAFLMGPFIQLWDEQVSQPVVKRAIQFFVIEKKSRRFSPNILK